MDAKDLGFSRSGPVTVVPWDDFKFSVTLVLRGIIPRSGRRRGIRWTDDDSEAKSAADRLADYFQGAGKVMVSGPPSPLHSTPGPVLKDPSA